MVSCGLEALVGREIWGVRTGMEGEPGKPSSGAPIPLLGLWLGRRPGEWGRIVGGPGEMERGLTIAP